MSKCQSRSDINRITAKKFISVFNAGYLSSYLSLKILAFVSVTFVQNNSVFAFYFSSILGKPLLFEPSSKLFNQEDRDFGFMMNALFHSFIIKAFSQV